MDEVVKAMLEYVAGEYEFAAAEIKICPVAKDAHYYAGKARAFKDVGEKMLKLLDGRPEAATAERVLKGEG